MDPTDTTTPRLFVNKTSCTPGPFSVARELAHGMQSSRDIGAFPTASCAAVLAGNHRVHIAESLDVFSLRANEVLAVCA